MGRTSSTSSSKGNDDRKPAAKSPVTRSVRGAASLKSPPTPGTEGFMPSRSPIAIRYSAPGGRTVAVQMTRETSLQAAASRGRSHEVHDSPTHQNSNVTPPNTSRDISTLFGSPDPSSLQAAASRHDSAYSNSNVSSNTGRNISTLFGSPDPTQGRSNSATPIVSPSDNANVNTGLAQYGFAATARRADMASSTTKCNYLKLAIIRGPGAPDVYHFIFCCENYKGPRCSVWHEKLFMDEMVRRAPWIEDLNFVEVLKWYENGVEVKNDRNFNVRLFRMEVRSPDPPLRERLLQLGEDICKIINELVQDDRAKIEAHPDKYFWFGFEHRTVWFDIGKEYEVVKVSYIRYRPISACRYLVSSHVVLLHSSY